MLNRITILVAVASVTVFCAGMVLASREIISPRLGLLGFVMGAALGLVALVLMVVVLFTTKTYPVAMFAVIGFLPLMTVVGVVLQGMRYPMINDISTDLADVPAFVHAQTLPANADRDMGYPKGFAEQVRESYPDVKPRIFDAPADRIFSRVVRQINAPGGHMEVTYEDAATGIVEGVAISRMFHWRDDFIVRVREADGKTVVDMRSKSRDGKGDLGANAKRIKTFLASIPETP